jgi:hypothetical protein
MKNYLKSWGFMRLLRLVLGILIIVQGVVAGDWLFAGAGLLLSLMPIMNIGCCGTSGCDTPVRKTNINTEEVSYEEVR